MNGMKLGVQSKPKNSFVYQNQFLNYENEDFDDEDAEEDEDQYEDSQEAVPESNKSKKMNLDLVSKQSNIPDVKKTQENKPPEKPIEQIKIAQPKIEKKQVIDQRINNLNQGMQKLSVSILQMKDGCEELEFKEQMIKNRSPKKEEEIKMYLEKKHAEKLNLMERKKMQMEKDRKKMEDSVKLQQEEKANKEKVKIEQNLKKLIEIRQRREAQKQRAAEQSKLVSQMYQKILQQQKSNKKFHFRKLQEDQKKQAQQLQRRKQYLAKRKEAYRSIDISELSQHQKRHEEMLNSLQESKKLKRQERIQKIQQQNAKLKQVYKGLSHEYVQEELEEIEHKKRQPKQKYEKMKEYQRYVRQNYIPKTHQPTARKVSNHNNRSSLSHREVKRYRYLNGVAYGQVIQNQPLPKTEAQLKKIGNQNLAFIRSLPKRRKIEQDSIQRTLSPEDLAILDKKLNSIVKVKRERNPLYQRKDHHSIQVKISKNPTRDEVTMLFSQLKAKDQQAKMKEKLLKHQGHNSNNLALSQRKINDDIVKNIEQKLSLLSQL